MTDGPPAKVVINEYLDIARGFFTGPEPGLANAAGSGYAPKPGWRPLTKFERRGLKLGHDVWDLLFNRLAA